MSATTTTSFTARRLSDEEWANLDEDEEGELVDGILVEEEAPDPAHEAVVLWLAYVLTGWLHPRGGIILGSEAKYILRRGRGRKPDLAVFLPGTKKPLRRGAVRHPPDVMVEVISSGTARDVRRDRLEKMDEHAAFGVRWYWLLDPEARVFEIYERAETGIYGRVRGGGAEGKLTSVPGFPDLVIDLDALWAKVDELPDHDDDEHA